jgi:hypothetical protein
VQEKSQLQDRHAREREQILLDAERDKANTVAASYKKIEQETRKAHARANFKVGLAFAAAAGVGGIINCISYDQVIAINTKPQVNN